MMSVSVSNGSGDARFNEPVRHADLAGKFLGRTATAVPNSASVLMNAQEELSMMRSATGERLVSRREVSNQYVISRSALFDLATNYLNPNKVADILESGLPQRLIDEIEKHLDKRSSDKQLIEKVATFFEAQGVATEYEKLSLVLLAKTLSKDNVSSEKLLKNLEIIGENICTGKHTEIAAGFNLDDHLKSRVIDDKPEGIVNSYSELVKKDFALAETYKHLKLNYGFGSMEEKTTFIMNALSSDINSMVSSTYLGALQSIVKKMSAIQIILGLRHECGEALEKLRKWKKPRIIDRNMLEELIELVGKEWPVASNVEQMCKRIVHDTPQAKVAFFNQLSVLVRSVPPHVFAEQIEYENLYDVVVAAKIESVAEEENEVCL